MDITTSAGRDEPYGILPNTEMKLGAFVW